jgi:hypothetical protein
MWGVKHEIIHYIWGVKQGITEDYQYSPIQSQVLGVRAKLLLDLAATKKTKKK